MGIFVPAVAYHMNFSQPCAHFLAQTKIPVLTCDLEPCDPVLCLSERVLVDPGEAVVAQRQRPQRRHALERPGPDPADVVVVQLRERGKRK